MACSGIQGKLEKTAGPGIPPAWKSYGSDAIQPATSKRPYIYVSAVKFTGAYAVANIPGSPSSGDVILVTDGDSACDTTTGSGGYISLHRYNGASWDCIGDGGAGAVQLDGLTDVSGTGTQYYVIVDNGDGTFTAGLLDENSLAASIDLSGKTIVFGLEASDIPDISATYQTTISFGAGVEAALANAPDAAGGFQSVLAEGPFVAGDKTEHDTMVGSGAQAVGTGDSPTFDVTNFSDGGTNIIPTSTQETNWDSLVTRFTGMWADRTALTGGVAGALDELSVASLSDNDIAIVTVGTQIIYIYLYDADATAAESSPNVIRPDDYVTQGNWELQLYISDGVSQLAAIDLSGGSLTIPTTTSGDQTLTVGKIGLKTDEDLIIVHAGANGEVQDEAGISLIQSLVARFYATAEYDHSSEHVIDLLRLGDAFPHGITITEWRIENIDGDFATTQLDVDLVCDTGGGLER